MAGRYDRINGAYCKVKKRYVRIGGAWTPVKKRFDKVNGVWVPSYSGTLEWTTQITPIPPDKAHWPGTDAGNSSIYSAYIHTPSSHAVDDWGCYVTYTFSQPLLMRAGQSLSIVGNAISMAENPDWTICINTHNNLVWAYTAPADKSFTDKYYFPTDIPISSIILDVGCSLSMASYSVQVDLTVVVDSTDFGSFLLNNSGSSDQ